jgi:hypothetical protein
MCFCIIITTSLNALVSEYGLSYGNIAKLITATVYTVSNACITSGLYKSRVYFFGDIKNLKLLKYFLGAARNRQQLIVGISLIFVGIFLFLLPSMLMSSSGPHG